MRVYNWSVLLVVMVLTGMVSVSHAAPPTNTPPANGKVKIFILAGQSNMVGMGEVKGGPGTMEDCLKANPKQYGHLVDRAGQPLTRNDVWVVNLSYRQQQGWLTVGFGANDHCIGPEYGFGWVMGEYYKDPVVIIKCAWGGRSLSHHFLPPSAGEYPKPEKDGDKGWQYAQTVRLVKQITGNLQKYVPGDSGLGYEIVGFGWHQGWNDRINQAAVDVYEQNMVHFIKDMRRDLGIKDLPFVIANTGMGGWDIPEKAPYKKRVEKLMEAQLAVADPKKHPEFKGTVAGVETRDFQKPQSESPSRQDYHWFRNWETYYQIGHAMAEAMIPMVQRPFRGR